MPMIRFETTMTHDRMIRVPEEYSVDAPAVVSVIIDTLEPAADFDDVESERLRIEKRAAELLSEGCPELDALAAFRVVPADFKFDREAKDNSEFGIRN